MTVQPAVEADVPSWLEIVREVEPLFGPMPDFETTLLRKIGQQAALCVRSGETAVLGGILLGGTREHGWIRWLAVRSKARAGGVGTSLVEAAVRRFKTARRYRWTRSAKRRPQAGPPVVSIADWGSWQGLSWKPKGSLDNVWSTHVDGRCADSIWSALGRERTSAPSPRVDLRHVSYAPIADTSCCFVQMWLVRQRKRRRGAPNRARADVPYAGHTSEGEPRGLSIAQAYHAVALTEEKLGAGRNARPTVGALERK